MHMRKQKVIFSCVNAHLMRIVNSDSIIPSPEQVTALNEDSEG